jgi:hypothetical protein
MDAAFSLLVVALGAALVGWSPRVASYLDVEVGGRDVPVFRIVRGWMTSRWYVVVFGLGMVAVGGVALLAST